jgi:selenophosphate synthetase-related protein
MAGLVNAMRARAAKDVSMAGIVGTAGMMAEASGTGAELDVSAIPRPTGAEMGSWLTCFPGFGMLTVDGSPVPVPDGVASEVCGRLTVEQGVRLRWPDGAVTTAVAAGVTGLGRA